MFVQQAERSQRYAVTGEPPFSLLISSLLKVLKLSEKVFFFMLQYLVDKAIVYTCNDNSVDVIEILTDSSIPRRYWSDLKKKLQAEGSEVYEKIVQLKMEAPDGKMRETDAAESLERARENWQKLGRSEKWIQQRMTGQESFIDKVVYGVGQEGRNMGQEVLEWTKTWVSLYKYTV